MRRLTLSTKLFAAALPLILAVGALLALTVRNDLEEVDHAERGASLGSLWTPLVGAMTDEKATMTNRITAALALWERGWGKPMQPPEPEKSQESVLSIDSVSCVSF